jgi:hypothetical protein
MPRGKGQKTKDEILKDKPGYVPQGQRPKCHVCGKELPIAPMAPLSDGSGRLFNTPIAESATRVNYGYDGDNIFCTMKCGYNFGLAVAKRVKAREQQQTPPASS